MSASDTVLVTGATGRQGGAVARQLVEAGFEVRALTRDPTKPAASALERMDVEVVRGDFDEPQSLDDALVGVDGVFSVQDYWSVGYEAEVRQGRTFVDAAKRAGVQHFVYASIAEAEAAPAVEHFASKSALEEYIIEVDLPYTFLGAVFFMENFLDPEYGQYMFPVLSGALHSDTRLHMVAVDDIGAVARIVFGNPRRFIGEKINIAGDRLDVTEMKAIYRTVTGGSPPRYSLPWWILRFMNRELLRQFRWNNDPGWSFPVDETRGIYPDLTSFEGFVQAHADEL